jgi:hypothetical protein
MAILTVKKAVCLSEWIYYSVPSVLYKICSEVSRSLSCFMVTFECTYDVELYLGGSLKLGCGEKFRHSGDTLNGDCNGEDSAVGSL